MADNDPKIPNPDSGKRPHATLDLKATEIKAAPAATPRTGATPGDSGKTPGPAPASSYAQAQKGGTTGGSASNPTDAHRAAARPGSSAAAPIPKRGGFFSHLAAGIAGGVIAIAASEFILPEVGVENATSRLSDANSTLALRVGAVEKKVQTPGTSELEQKVADLESTAEAIPALKDAHAQLVADTKAALAAAASDAGEPEQLTRLAALEDKFKALVEAGANDPNAGRLEQLAALTGKVADLETSLATQLTEVRRSVAADVDGRIVAATEASEAAKSGAQRIDRDVAGVKGEAIRIDERLVALKADSDRTSAALKLAQDETAAVKAELSSLRNSAAKPSDLAAAIAPVQQRVAALDSQIQSVAQTQAERKADSQRVALSLELQNLKRALESGRPYGSELDGVVRYTDAKLDLDALEKFKATGLPPAADFAKDFRPIANAAIDAEEAQTEGTVVDKLIAGAKSVVRIRKVSHTPDDKSTEAIVGRIELALKEGRLSEAITEAENLTPKAQAVVEPFLDKVAARVAVEDAVDRLETELKSSLGAPAAPASQ